MSIYKVPLHGCSGSLELLYSPPKEESSTKPPLLFIHGSYCSAHCYENFLPYLAKFGYAAYALSVRGHGSSEKQNSLKKLLFTTMNDWAEDIQTSLNYIVAHHRDAPPAVIAGHSLGGGAVQHALSLNLLDGNRHSRDGVMGNISGLILLGSSPIFGGGKEIMSDWEKIEAPEGAPHFWSPRPQLDTPQQVRASFFSDETPEETVVRWIDKCRTPVESGRVGLSIFKPVGHPRKVLESLIGIGPPGKTRKVLCVAGSVDALVAPSMVLANASAYSTAAKNAGLGPETCLVTTISGSGHHLMMDAHWETCAQEVLRWLEGDVTI